MHLTLDPLDLAPQFQKKVGGYIDQAINTSQVTFEKLNPRAQAAVVAVGKGTFHSLDDQTHNAIYAPKSV